MQCTTSFEITDGKLRLKRPLSPEPLDKSQEGKKKVKRRNRMTVFMEETKEMLLEMRRDIARLESLLLHAALNRQVPVSPFSYALPSVSEMDSPIRSQSSSLIYSFSSDFDEGRDHQI